MSEKEQPRPLEKVLTDINSSGKAEVLPPMELEAHQWTEIRLFISSTFIDTHGERDLLIQKTIPRLNEVLRKRYIRVVPVDLRWGVSKEDSANCHAIQRTCLNEVDQCRVQYGKNVRVFAYFLGFRTQRYGWIQDQLMESDCYDLPEFYAWVKTLKEHGKQLSITSLECIHASLTLKNMLPAKTIFFYKRSIQNRIDMEPMLQWIFDFEYVDENKKVIPELAKQYENKSGNVLEAYIQDKDGLDNWLKSLPHVEYKGYQCVYVKGGAKKTGQRPDGKMFGIGRVSQLEQLEEMMFDDLLNSIEKNFVEKKVELTATELQNVPYEIALREKASSFIGRSEIVNRLFDHCKLMVEPNLMVVVGEPGCGKSALVSYVAERCMSNLRQDKNNFLFVHGVDTCPQSNDLENMLMRLHKNMCEYAGDENMIKTTNDLRERHITQLEAIASNNPSKSFVVIVDAVNQLYADMNAWSMWWVPTETSPKNLRILISTLPDENNTYKNIRMSRPAEQIHEVKVDVLNKEEAMEMVTKILAKYNKKLTTDDADGFLGNQMELLLEKSTSPLYLAAACEALRTQGVYEHMTKYIRSLPNNIQGGYLDDGYTNYVGLFEFLMNGWEESYGRELISLIVCIITLSRDGILENVISKLLLYIEKKNEAPFESSFSVVYSVLRGFLSSGGGGYLHFFHDQLNQVVWKKYLKSNPEFEAKVHSYLSEFYLDGIRSQLTEKPTLTSSIHHDNYIRNVVYHQIEAGRFTGQAPDFYETLRNIFFIREKIVAGQTVELTKEYLSVHTSDDTLFKCLNDWKRFVNIYSTHIEKYPSHSFRSAINHCQSSAVYQDTVRKNETVAVENFPAYWVNKPEKERIAVLTKYHHGNCGVTLEHEDIVAVAEEGSRTGNHVYLYDKYSGELLHQILTFQPILSMCFVMSKRKLSLWCGDYGGFVHVIDAATGRLEWKSTEPFGTEVKLVIWLHQIGEIMMCGVKNGTMALFSIATKEIVKSWKVDSRWCEAYCYNSAARMLFTGHRDGTIKSWSVHGELISELKVGEEVVGWIDVHPVHDAILLCFIDRKITLLSAMTGKLLWVNDTVDLSHCTKQVRYGGTHLAVCVDRDDSTMVLLNAADGREMGSIQHHREPVKNINVIDEDHLISSGNEGCFLLNIPSAADKPTDEMGDLKHGEVWSSALLADHFIILRVLAGRAPERRLRKADRVRLEQIDVESLSVVQSCEIECEIGGSGGKMLPHPTNDQMVVLLTRRGVMFVNTKPFSVAAVHNIIDEDLSRKWPKDIALSNDGLKCVLPVSFGVFLLDVSKLDDIKTITQVKGYTMYSADINGDGSIIVTSDVEGLKVWDSTLSQFSEIKIKDSYNKDVTCHFLRMLNKPERIAVLHGNNELIHIWDLKSGKVLRRLEGKKHEENFSMLDEKRLITGSPDDNSLLVIDVDTGKIIFKFFHHSSKGFRRFSFHQKTSTLCCENENGQVYFLKTLPK